MEKAQQKLDFFDSLSSPKGRAKGCGRICPPNFIFYRYDTIKEAAI